MRWVAAVAGVAAIAVLGVTMSDWVRTINGHGSPAERFVAFDGPMKSTLSRGCGYLFHDERRWQTIDGTWKGGSLRWDKRPAGQGHWTTYQQRQVVDNVTVGRGGALVPAAEAGPDGECLHAWNQLPQRSWQRIVARNFEVAGVYATDASA